MTLYRDRANSGGISFLGFLMFASLLPIRQACAADTNAATPAHAAHDLTERAADPQAFWVKMCQRFALEGFADACRVPPPP